MSGYNHFLRTLRIIAAERYMPKADYPTAWKLWLPEWIANGGDAGGGRLGAILLLNDHVSHMVVGTVAERKRLVAAIRAEIAQHPGCDGWIASLADELEADHG